MLVLAALLLLVAAGLTGLGSYTAKQARDTSHITRCGARHCLGGVDLVRIEADLTAHGFSCSSHVVRNCSYQPVHRRYNIAFQETGGGLESVGVTVYVRDGFISSTREANLLVWVAGQVFAGDDAAMARVESWLRERVSGRSSATMTLDGYLLEFTPVDDSDVMLWIRAA
jgi:hypothetical protein